MESSKTDMGFIKVCARWVPKQLTEEHKGNSLTAYPGLLNYYRDEGDIYFLRRIFTGDETWTTIKLQEADTTIWNGNIRHCQSKGCSELNHRWEK
jgi:hypothetical protein